MAGLEGRSPRIVYEAQEIALLDKALLAKKELGQGFTFSDAEIDGLAVVLAASRNDAYKRSGKAIECALTNRKISLGIIATKQSRKVSGLAAGGTQKPESAKPIPSVNKIMKVIKAVFKAMGKSLDELKPLEEALANGGSKGKVAKLEKDIKTLKAFLIPARMALEETCELRLKAAALTERTKELKKKTGVDLFDFMRQLKECQLLKE